MKQKYPYIFKILLATVFALLAFLIPIVSVRLVLGLIAVIILSFNLRKFTAFFITFVILFFLIPSLLTMFVTNFQQPADFINDLFGGTVRFGYNLNERGYDYSYEDNLKIMRADKEIPINEFMELDGEEIYVNLDVDVRGVNLNIDFDDESEVIEIPEELSYEIENGVLKIFYDGDWSNKRADISIGTENMEYKSLDIRSVVLDVRGDLNTKDLKINSTTTKMYLDLIADNFDITSTTAKLDGEFIVDNFISSNTTSVYRINFEGNSFYMNSTNVEMNGIFKSKDIAIKGVNVSANLSVENANLIRIDSNMSNLDIKYLDLWQGNRTLDINSKIGKAKVGVKEKMVTAVGESTENYGELIINTEGRYTVERYTFLGY
jgi:membrane protein implicated in regulation of membrane protease activity